MKKKTSLLLVPVLAAILATGAAAQSSINGDALPPLASAQFINSGPALGRISHNEQAYLRAKAAARANGTSACNADIQSVTEFERCNPEMTGTNGTLGSKGGNGD